MVGRYSSIHCRIGLHFVEGRLNYRVSCARTHAWTMNTYTELLSFDVVFGPNIPSLLFPDRCLFGLFIYRLSHLLDPLFQWMCFQNTMALSQCSGEMSISGCLSCWCLLSAICVISFGNSKCLVLY